MSFPPSPSPPPPLPSPALLPTPLPSPPPLTKKPAPRQTSSPPGHAFGAPTSPRAVRRRLPSRCRSPPPSPVIRSPPPPVPPIPAFVLARNKSFDPANMRHESQPRSPLTCMQFLAVHNPKGHCHA